MIPLTPFLLLYHCAGSVKLQTWLNPTLYLLLKGSGKNIQSHWYHFKFMIENLKCSLNTSPKSHFTSLIHCLSSSCDYFICFTLSSNSHTFSPIFMATDSTPLRKSKLLDDNFPQTLTIISTHPQASALVFSDSCPLVQMKYSCSSLKPLNNHPLLPTHGYHSNNSPCFLLHNQGFFLLVYSNWCMHMLLFFHSKQNFLAPLSWMTPPPPACSKSTRWGCLYSLSTILFLFLSQTTLIFKPATPTTSFQSRSPWFLHY